VQFSMMIVQSVTSGAAGIRYASCGLYSGQEDYLSFPNDFVILLISDQLLAGSSVHRHGRFVVASRRWTLPALLVKLTCFQVPRQHTAPGRWRGRALFRMATVQPPCWRIHSVEGAGIAQYLELPSCLLLQERGSPVPILSNLHLETLRVRRTAGVCRRVQEVTLSLPPSTEHPLMPDLF